MPDHSPAASEHAPVGETTAAPGSLPDDPVAAVAEVDFPLTLRGYDRLAVDAYVKQTSRLVAELQATRSPEAAVRRALEQVGEEVSSILQRAHETAAQITAESRREADDRLERARVEAAEITAAAERRARELDAETDRIWAERHRLVEDVRKIAERLQRIADAACERFPAAEEPGEPDAAPTPAPDDARRDAALAGEHSGEATVILPAPDDREPPAEDDGLDDRAP